MEVFAHSPEDPCAVLVCVSGLGSNHTQWNAVATAADDMAVVSYDREGIDVDEAAAELEDVVALAKRRYPGLPVVVLAHSWGAMIAHVWATTPRPGVVGLILADPSFPGNSEWIPAPLQRVERTVARVHSQHSARELPAFYHAWKTLQARDLAVSDLKTLVISADNTRRHRHHVDEIRVWAETIGADCVVSRSRKHALPTSDPGLLAGEARRLALD
ncbi:MAG: alpha/beta fold hydrolase [Actinomycetaceae bacterium]|nr:alpha/beta fold hydrolase [Actinomycetaceae bacterium]MDU0969801.1 alpha/beta fold hydrolase [Actinomycetaceae bacterium]